MNELSGRLRMLPNDGAISALWVDLYSTCQRIIVLIYQDIRSIYTSCLDTTIYSPSSHSRNTARHCSHHVLGTIIQNFRVLWFAALKTHIIWVKWRCIFKTSARYDSLHRKRNVIWVKWRCKQLRKQYAMHDVAEKGSKICLCCHSYTKPRDRGIKYTCRGSWCHSGSDVSPKLGGNATVRRREQRDKPCRAEHTKHRTGTRSDTGRKTERIGIKLTGSNRFLICFITPIVVSSRL